MTDIVRSYDAPSRASIPENPLAFLASFDGPTALRIPGRDRSRVRVVTTLLHGNEPSGFLAVHSWLREDIEPATDVLFLIANIEAASLHPVFTHRSVPNRRDLNRCFRGPRDDVEGRIAHAMRNLVKEARPEALIDLHNNTGRNPPYGVGMEPTRGALELTALFGDAFVWSHLELGALLEVIDECPAVTIEVGKSGDAEADRVARVGLGRFLERDALVAGPASQVRVLKMPMRARIAPDRSLVIAQRPDALADLTMPDDLDRHNFQTVPVGSRIGWVKGAGCPLQLIDEQGVDRATDYFVRRGDELTAARPFMPIMISVDAAIASSDCVFYVVHEAGQEA